ncbi:MAG TPA: glycoside hydrolase, partial [Armatimonadota bacterium]|nr:glycoside hydrolase [Armatimonadota bacterium]
SRQINVGLDETIDLGKGKSKAACEERGVGRVYLDFLLKLHDLAQQRGHTMQFWGDIIMHHPELIASLPGGIIALEWGYEANHPFAADGKKFADAGVPFYVCPGTSSWNTIAGRTDNAVGNLRNAAENGQACGAIGFLNTDWGDNGHWQHLPIAFLGYAYGAAESWAAAANQDLPLARALSLHVFKDNAGVMGQLAYDLGNAYQQPGVLVGNASILFHFLLWPEQSLTEGDRARLSVESLQRTEEYIDRVMAPLDNAQMERPDAALILEEFRNAAALMRHGCKLTIARLQAGGGAIATLSAETRQALAADLAAIISDYRRLWLSRNRPGGLRESVGRLEKLLALYQQ